MSGRGSDDVPGSGTGNRPGTRTDEARAKEVLASISRLIEAGEDGHAGTTTPLRLEETRRVEPEGDPFEAIDQSPPLLLGPQARADETSDDGRADSGDDEAGPGLYDADRAVDAALRTDPDALRDYVTRIVRAELSGDYGRRVTRNLRKLVRQEIRAILAEDDLG